MNGFDVIHDGQIIPAKALAKHYADEEIREALFVINDKGALVLEYITTNGHWCGIIFNHDYSLSWHKTPVEELTQDLTSMFDENGVHWMNRKYKK